MKVDAETRLLIEQLIAQWRTDPKPDGDEFDSGVQIGREQCADELSALLQSVRSVPTQRESSAERLQRETLERLNTLTHVAGQSVRSVTPQEKIGVAHLHSMFNIVIRKHYGAEVPSCSGEACRACEDVAREFPHLKEIIEDPPKTVTPQEQSVEAIIAAFNEGFALGTLKRLDQAWEGSQTKRNLETTSRREGPLRYRLPEGNPPLPIPTPPASSEQP